MRCFCTPSWSSPAVAETSSLWGVRGALNSALDRVERDSPICGIVLILRERELYTALDAVFCFPVSTWGLFPVHFFTFFFVVILLFTDNNNHFSWCFISLQDDMSDSLRDYTNLPEAAPLLTILDMSARAKYVKDVEEITPAVVEQFVSDFLAEKLKPEPIWSPWTPCTLLPEPPSGPWPPGVLSLLFLSDGSNRSVLCIDILLLIRAPPSRSGRLLLWCLAFTTALMVKCRF